VPRRSNTEGGKLCLPSDFSNKKKRDRKKERKGKKERERRIYTLQGTFRSTILFILGKGKVGGEKGGQEVGGENRVCCLVPI